MMLLSLMGEQTIPNLLPLWQFRSRIQATRFAATSTTRPFAEGLRLAIEKDRDLSGVKVYDPLILEAYDMGKARRRLSEAIGFHQEQGEEVILNLTGGTKLMSLAALQAAFGSGVQLMYVANEVHQIVFHQSDGAEVSRVDIAVQISVQQYLEACGLEFSLTQNFRPPNPLAAAPPPKEGDALEEKVYQLAKDSGWFDDVQRGVYVRRQTPLGGVNNELDVVVTRNGNLAVCSCKAVQAVTNDALYELSAISSRENLGIYCGKVLATTSREVSDAQRNRARASRIELVDGSQVDNIAFYLKKVTG